MADRVVSHRNGAGRMWWRRKILRLYDVRGFPAILFFGPPGSLSEISMYSGYPESHPEVERLPYLPPHRAGRGAAEARRRKRFEPLQESDVEVVQIITTFVPLQTAM